ncbi:S41 family peptidase [Clostridium sp. AL.422]|uniref:S41 family peptidase n=1 Tax=Clostridium TaxID=1485 RepID=UPI00293DEDCE|nr:MULTISPECIES: S41 family peptidase [unclassified Clostridium]MDV4152085.1 S41 family peptidase [Clostridium sp. AL.422]
MKKNIWKVIRVSVLSIILLVGGFFVYLYFNQPISIYKVKEFESIGNPNLDKELSKEEVKEDIENIIDIVEKTHPIFLEEVPEKYYNSKKEILSVSNSSMTVGSLQKEISKYLSSIEDGHTSLRWSENMFLNVEWKYKDGKLILLDKDKKLTNKRIKKIGNVDIDRIVQIVQETFPAENSIAEARNIERYSKEKYSLESIGVNNNNNINLTIENGEKEENLEVKFNEATDESNSDYSIYIKKIDEETGYIRLGICEINSYLEAVLIDIGEYRNQGINNFIIDVTDNPGGNSTACSMILEALDIEAGHYGSVIRFSPLAQEQRGYLRKSGNISYKSNNKVVKNDDINLYVLTNEATFSSAQMLCVWVSDGNLGTLVGRPSSNMPSSYGDVLTYQLKNSKLIGQVSHKKWTRPDISKDSEPILEPDIYVEYGDDILEVALKDIENKK